LGAVTKFYVFYMIFIIFKIKIDMKEESGFLITNSPLRSLRLCVMIFLKNSLCEGYFERSIKCYRLLVGFCYAKIRG